MISVCAGPLPTGEQSRLSFALPDCARILTRSVVAYTHPSTLSWTSRATCPLSPWVRAPSLLRTAQCVALSSQVLSFSFNNGLYHWLLCYWQAAMFDNHHFISGLQGEVRCCVCVCRDVERECCWALSFESQVTTLLFQRTPLVFIILPPHQIQGAQPHARTCTSWWETERTPQVFWPVKISLLVWHFLSYPNTTTLATPFYYTWTLCAAVKGNLKCARLHSSKKLSRPKMEPVCHQLQSWFFFLLLSSPLRELV